VGISDRREREKQELRGRILDASRRLFAEKGFEAVTIRTIAEAVEYSPRTIYLYFKDKEDLIRELCREDFGSFGAELGRLFRIADPLERLRAMGASYVRFGLEHPHHYKLMFMTPPAMQDDPDKPGKGNPEADAYAAVVTSVQEGMDRGLFRPELQDAHLLAQVIWAGVHGTAALAITHGKDQYVPWADLSSRIETILDVTLRGIRR
jgi:AcrR family transcriptional regulator